MTDLIAHVSLQFKDALGVVASVPYFVDIDSTATMDDIVTAIQVIPTDIDALTDAQILLADLVVQVPLPTVKTAPVAGSEIERGGLFNFLQENIKYKFGILIPALKHTLIVNGKINLADTAVTTFISLVTALGGTAPWRSTANNILVTLADALITFRKHRKAESRRSFEVGS